MSWLSHLLSRKKVQTCQPTPPSTATTSQPPASMTQVVVEETIMAVAKWLVNLVNRTLETKATPQKQEQEPLASPAPAPSPEVNVGDAPPHPVGTGQVSTVDQLLAKFSCLIEESCDRTQAITLLESRLQGIESALQANKAWEESVQLLSQAVVKLNGRLAQVEQSLEQLDPATLTSKTEAHFQQWVQLSNEQMTASNARLAAVETALETVGERESSTLDELSQALQSTVQQATVLEGRISYLEKMIARLSLVPKYVESNYRSIASLQNSMKQLKVTPVASGNGSQR